MDTSAWLHYLDRTPQWRHVARLIEGKAVFATTVTLAELADKCVRRGTRPEGVLAFIQRRSTLLQLTPGLGLTGAYTTQALRKHAKDASLVDGINLATARAIRATLLTSDKDFDRVPDALVV